MKPENPGSAVATAPLLPRFHSPENPSPRCFTSISGAVFNVSTSMVGAGIMSIPATFKVLGIIPGLILILIVALSVEVTVEFLLRYTNSGKAVTYGGLMAESFGKFGSVGLQVCVMVTNLGALIIYLIIIGDVLCGNQSEGTLHLGVLQEWFGIQWWNSRTCALLFVVLFIMLPLLLIRSIVHPVRAELSRPSEMSSAVRISLVLCVVIYFAVGLFGYLLFGDSIMADILVNFDQNADSAIGALLNDTVRLSYAIHLMMVFPVVNFSLRANVDELLFPRKPLLATDTCRFLSLTCVLLALMYLAAIAIPNIWYFFQFIGTTTVMCLMFIFPSAIILRDVHGISTTRDKILAVLVIILAVGTSLIAISSNVYNSVRRE